MNHFLHWLYSWGIQFKDLETNGKGFWSPLQDIKPYELYKIGDQIILS